MRTRDKIRATFYTLIFISITATSYGNLVSYYSLEINVTTHVSRFIDGDSFEVPGDEVRLADVSAPEWNEPGGDRATQALYDLLVGKTIYLDTDQKSGRGPYGRLIALVYVKHDSTRYMNVNKALLNQGVVDLTDYTNNEFDPSSWRLHVSTLNNQDIIKFLSISAGLGFIVCLLFHYVERKISNLITRMRDEYTRARMDKI
jgi:endonuclease YncB( thermonuclease family)